MRIIPTRMGTRLPLMLLIATLEDHPHAYGDKAIFSAYRHGGMGSSPRVWGQDFFDVSFNASYRIIPTRMGTRCVLIVAHTWR